MRKHKYLNRVALTILFLVFIPIIILSLVIWQRASKELKKSNEAYYNQLVSSFEADFEGRVSSLQEHALSIVVDSKKDKSIFHHRIQNGGTYYYWYYQAVHEMQDNYLDYNIDYCGIYYYDEDRAVTSFGCLPRLYIMSGLGIRDISHPSWKFFDSSEYVSGKWIFSSTYTTPEKDSSILAGYCTELGKDKDQVMIFYALSRDEYAKTQSVVYEQSGINFYILDEAREDTYMFIGDSRASAGTAYTCQSRWLPLTYEIRVTDNFLAHNSEMFYRETWLILIALMVILALTCAATIAIVYRPVFSINAELGYSDWETDEFGNIRNALGERKAKIMEQEVLIMDLLLNHLIHGVPISQKVVGRLGVAKNVDHYCVLVSNEYVLPASEVETLAERIEQIFSARLFCTDWHTANKSLLILFLPGPDAGPVVAVLNDWIKDRCGEGAFLTAGEVVSNIDDIRESFLSCLERVNARSKLSRPIKEEIRTLDAKDQQQKALEKKVLEYLDKHFRDEDLSQIKVADEFQISTYTMSRLFKNQVGIGFREYVNSKRLEYAKTLLLTTTLSIKEISEKAGYTSETYFGRIFKATYGISPSMFKEQ